MRRLRRAAALALLALPAPLLAQTTVQTTSAAPRGSRARAGSNEEIVVTATRRSSAISRVPVSLTAFTQATLDAKGARDISDVVRFTPGTSFDPVTNNVSIRGISSEAGAGTTGLYIDDTPMQVRNLGFNAENSLPELFDLERVEILRGPQGTLFGAGSEGGTVRYITPQPGLDEYASYGRATASFSPDGAPSYDLGAALGGPIIRDTLGFRISVSHEFDGGYLDHVNYLTGAITDRDTNSVDTTTFRSALAYQPFEGLLITPSVFYQQRLKGDTDAYFPTISDPAAGLFRNDSPSLVRDDDRFYLPSLNVKWNLKGVSVLSNTSWLHRNNLTGYDGTLYNLSYYNTLPGILPPYAPLLLPTGINPALPYYKATSRVINRQDNFSQEVRLQSSNPALRLSWVAGVFYEHDRQFSSEQLQDPLVNNLFVPVFGQTIEQVLGSPLAGIDSYINQTSAVDRQIAVFGNATYRILDGLKLTGGLRYANTSFSFTNFANGPQNGGFMAASGGTTENPVTGNATISYQITPRDLVYLGWARGYRVGGADAPVPQYSCAADLSSFGISQAPTSYRSDSVDSWEIGAKDRLLGGRLQLAVSAFYINWSDIQQDVLLPTCGIQYTTNLGDAISRGFDAQATLTPTEGVTLDTLLGFTDAHYTTDGTAGSYSASLISRAGDSIGDPAWKLSLGARYDLPETVSFYGGRTYVRADYQYVGPPSGTVPDRDPHTAEDDPGYVITDATNALSLRGGMVFGNGVNVSVFVDNLLNATPRLSHLHETLGSALYYDTTLRPLYAGVEVTFRQ
jgi:outer membrane receptor protein involved in Fe transport